MAVDPNEVAWVKELLWPDETADLTVRQRRIGPGGSLTVPTSVIATNKRLMIVNKATLGIRKDYEVIPYNQITSVRLENGILSSSVFIRVQGYDRDKGLLKKGKEEGEIDGLNNRDAKALSDYINRRLEDSPETNTREQADKVLGAYMFCTKCGTKNNADAKFCSSCGSRLV